MRILILYYETRLSSIISFTELLLPFTRRAPHLSCACPLITTSQKVLNFSLEMTRLIKIEKWLEAWPLGCHPARNGHVTR